MVQHRRILQGPERHIRHHRTQRGHWPGNRKLGLLLVQGVSFRPAAVFGIPFRGVQFSQSPELGRSQYHAVERGVWQDYVDANRHASIAVWAEARFLKASNTVTVPGASTPFISACAGEDVGHHLLVSLVTVIFV